MLNSLLFDNELLKDGASDDAYGPIAQEIRDDGVDIFAVGIGRARTQELVEITGNDVSFFWMKHFYETFRRIILMLINIFFLSNESGRRELSTTSVNSTRNSWPRSALLQKVNLQTG